MDTAKAKVSPQSELPYYAQKNSGTILNILTYLSINLNRMILMWFLAGSHQNKHVEHETGGCCDSIMTTLCWMLFVFTFPISFFVCYKVVQEYERVVIFRLGHLVSGKAKGPGMLLILPCIDTFRKVDLRVTVFDIPPQEVK